MPVCFNNNKKIQQRPHVRVCVCVRVGSLKRAATSTLSSRLKTSWWLMMISINWLLSKPWKKSTMQIYIHTTENKISNGIEKWWRGVSDNIIIIDFQFFWILSYKKKRNCHSWRPKFMFVFCLGRWLICVHWWWCHHYHHHNIL